MICCLDGNYTRMLQAILNKSWQQHPTRHQLYGHLPPITKTIQARRTRHAGHCWRSKDEIVSDVLLYAYGQSKAGRPARTYIQQLCDDMGCNPKDLLEAMNDRETWRERVRDIHASRTTWWSCWYIILEECWLSLNHFVGMCQTKCIYFLNFSMTTPYPSVIIIFVRKHTNYYCNPFIILLCTYYLRDL